MTFAFDNTYARLPERFFARLAPIPVAEPRLIKLNEALAGQLGLKRDLLRSPEGLAMLAGNQVPIGASPLAMAYAGHQFGNWVPQLGGRPRRPAREVVGPALMSAAISSSKALARRPSREWGTAGRGDWPCPARIYH